MSDKTIILHTGYILKDQDSFQKIVKLLKTDKNIILSPKVAIHFFKDQGVFTPKLVAQQKVMKEWLKLHSGKDFEGFVFKIFYNAEDFDSSKYIVLQVCIKSQHLYLVVKNDSNTPPIEIKRILSEFKEKQLDEKISLTFTTYSETGSEWNFHGKKPYFY